MSSPTPAWTILDCSLRDGGYLNDWTFPLPLAVAHIAHLDALGVTMAEIGFRSLTDTSPQFLGQFAHSGPALLRELELHAPNVRLGVMVNESEFATASELAGRIDNYLGDGELPFVRIATHPKRLSNALQLAKTLVSRGVETFINLMQIDRVSKDDLSDFARNVSGLGLSGLYIADSLGSLRPRQAAEIVELLTSRSGVRVGAHFHDNFGLAFANSLAAIEAGASFIDGTVLGIGRGAGNTRLEFLLLEHPSVPAVQEIAGLVDLWNTWVVEATDLTAWGPSLDYALAARSRVHPTFVQKMIEKEAYTPAEQVTVIEQLGRKSASQFSENAMEIGNEWFSSPGTTSPEVRELFRDADILLLGAGPSLDRWLPEISRTAVQLGLTICIVGSGTPNIAAEYRIISQPTSMISRPESLRSGPKNIAPFSQLADRIPSDIRGAEDLSIDLELSATDFGFNGERVFASSARSSIVALALIAGLAPASILVAGFDGFPAGDTRNHEFVEALRRLRASNKKLYSLTPTAFDLEFRGFE